MDSWKECQLGDLIEVKYGKDHKKLDEGKYPCIGSGGIMRYVDSYLYDKESILIPRKGSLNNLMYREKPFWTVDTMFWSKIIDESVLPKFLFYQLTLIDYTILNVGSAVPSLTVPVISEIDVNLPPLPEQKAIAEVLSSLDDKIDLLYRQNKTLEAMAETLFRQWFVEEADENWEESSPYTTLPLSEFIDINPKESLMKGAQATYLEMKNVRSNSSCPELWYSREYKSGTKFRNGDTIMARITPCLQNGKRAFVQFLKSNEIGWGSTEFLIFRTKEPYHPFTSYLLASNSAFKAFAEKSMTGSSGRQRVQTNSLWSFDLKRPSKEKIEELNLIFEEFSTKIHLNDNQIQTLTNLRDTLLPKLMSGEVRVKMKKSMQV